jgi:hypothetical protein
MAFVRVPQMTLWTNAIRPYITHSTKIAREPNYRRTMIYK